VTEEQIRLEMRVRALEGLVASMLAAQCSVPGADDPSKAFSAMSANVIANAKVLTFPGLDPAMSDLHSAELEAALTRLLDTATQLVATIQKSREG
jgi:hypothetical protein